MLLQVSTIANTLIPALVTNVLKEKYDNLYKTVAYIR